MNEIEKISPQICVSISFSLLTFEDEREREIKILLSSFEVKYDLWDQKYYISRDMCESE